MTWHYYIQPDEGIQPYRFDTVFDLEEYIQLHNLPTGTMIIIKDELGRYMGEISLYNYIKFNEKWKKESLRSD